MTKEEKRTEIFNSGRAWIVACVAIIASILISVNCNKLPATMSLVIPALGIDTGMAANIMSLNGYVGLVMTFVVAAIIMKFGARRATTLVLACAALGAVISAMATSVELLVVGRLIEGVGYACIGSVVPVIISEWFPPSKRGLEMWVVFRVGSPGFHVHHGHLWLLLQRG